MAARLSASTPLLQRSVERTFDRDVDRLRAAIEAEKAAALQLVGILEECQKRPVGFAVVQIVSVLV